MPLQPPSTPPGSRLTAHRSPIGSISISRSDKRKRKGGDDDEYIDTRLDDDDDQEEEDDDDEEDDFDDNERSPPPPKKARTSDKGKGRATGGSQPGAADDNDDGEGRSSGVRPQQTTKRKGPTKGTQKQKEKAPAEAAASAETAAPAPESEKQRAQTAVRRALSQIAPGINQQIDTLVGLSQLQDSGTTIQLLRHMLDLQRLATEASIYQLNDPIARASLITRLSMLNAPEIFTMHTRPMSDVWGMAGNPLLVLASLSSQVSFMARRVEEPIPTFGSATDEDGYASASVHPNAPMLPHGFSKPDQNQSKPRPGG